jgi:hypothetical protein
MATKAGIAAMANQGVRMYCFILLNALACSSIGEQQLVSESTVVVGVQQDVSAWGCLSDLDSQQLVAAFCSLFSSEQHEEGVLLA